MNITSKQVYQIVSGMVSGLMTGAALLTPLFGPDITPKIIAGLGIINIMVSSFGIAVSGQGQLVKDVAAMPGVEKVTVNAQASPALAAVATDQEQPKIAPVSPEVRTILNATVKGA